MSDQTPEPKPETRRKIRRTEWTFTATEEYDGSVRNRMNSTLHGMETDRHRAEQKK